MGWHTRIAMMITQAQLAPHFPLLFDEARLFFLLLLAFSSLFSRSIKRTIEKSVTSKKSIYKRGYQILLGRSRGLPTSKKICK
jgi:hypothetical protein